MSKFKNKESSLYIRTGETMKIRILEEPTIRTKGNRTYMNFSGLCANHMFRQADGAFDKQPCTNPYKRNDVICHVCEELKNSGKPNNVQKEYRVEVQAEYSSGNARDGGDDVSEIIYDPSIAYDMTFGVSFANALKIVFEKEMMPQGVSLNQLKNVWLTVEKSRYDPWYTIHKWEYDANTPLPQVARRADVQGVKTPYTPAGAGAGTGFSRVAGKSESMIGGFSLSDFTPSEKSFIADLSGEIKGEMANGAEITADIVEEHMLASMPVVVGNNDDPDHKAKKVRWALQNMFDHKWDLAMNLDTDTSE